MVRTLPLKALMVDVDGVVVHPNHHGGWAANLERDLGLSVAQLQERFFKPHFGDIVHGRADLFERLRPVLAEVAPHVSAETLVAYWFAQDCRLDHRLLEQLAEVRARGVELHLATVQEHRRADYLWRVLDLRSRFDAMHYAADLGWAKPAPEFYAAVEARTGFAGAELFFIDDRVANIEAAQARGWRGAVWTPQQRLSELIAQAGF